MKCHYCGHNIKEGFLTVGDVIKAGRFHQIKCPKCRKWCEVLNAAGGELNEQHIVDRINQGVNALSDYYKSAAGSKDRDVTKI